MSIFLKILLWCVTTGTQEQKFNQDHSDIAVDVIPGQDTLSGFAAFQFLH